jgi:hypothetical protein
MPDANYVYRLRACGQEWKLYANNSALRSIERESGKTITELMRSDRGVGGVTAMLWGCLVHHHPTATMQTADDIMDDVGYKEVVGPVSEAIARARPFRGMSGIGGDKTGSSPEETRTNSGE